MRLTVLTTAALVGLLLSGCIADEAADVPTAPEERAAPERADLNETLADMQEFCDSESDCDFWDQMFHEYVVYDLDTTVLDVVIVPPAGPGGLDALAASRLSVQAWEDGIRAFAQPWFNESLEVNVYAVGVDVPSVSAVQDPEIVVVSSSAAGLIGIGLEPKQIACLILGEGGAVAPETVAALALQPAGQTLAGDHTHDRGTTTGRVFATDCTGTEFVCFALNVGGAEPRDLYDLIAHEVGHCLGGGHVGDALDFRARYAPVEDIMSYQSNPEQVHCVSNLNVRVLEGVYAHLVPGSNATSLPAGSFLEIDPRDYEQVACPNP